MTELTTPTVAAMVGISYRQIDHLLRVGGIVTEQAGFGRYRLWTPDQVHRLQVAVALNKVLLARAASTIKPTTITSQLPSITQAVVAGPDPGGNWVALRGDVVSYASTPAGLFPAALDENGAIVTRMPELWP